MSQARLSSPSFGFSVGICATGESDSLPGLVADLLSLSNPAGLHLHKVIVVASACPGRLLSRLKGLQTGESRLHIVAEDARHGKADAINKILARAEGDFIVLVNSDAHPEPGAVPALLSVISADPNVGAISAAPVTEPKGGLASALVDYMWAAHNECSLILNHMNLSNHACDELVVFRSNAVGRLPPEVVNDGAFMAATVRGRGYSVKFCAQAKVRIETPNRVSDLIGQRRRIIFGHTQVWREVGRPPKTIESLLFLRPSLALKLMVRTTASRPRNLLVLPVAVLSELAASLLAVSDGLRSTRRHTVWKRFT